MIYYSTDSWAVQIFRFRGTVWREIWWKVALVLIYTLAAFLWCSSQSVHLGHMRKNILGGTLSFLLVFRANTAYSRYWMGRTVLTTFFCDLREFAALSIIAMRGGRQFASIIWNNAFDAVEQSPEEADKSDTYASGERVEIVRWCVVLAVAVQMHTRLVNDGLIHGSMSRETKWLVDWDRFRIRHLTTADEFRRIDSYVRRLAIPLAAWDDPDIDESFFHVTDRWNESPPEDDPEHLTTDRKPNMRLPIVVMCMMNKSVMRNIDDKKHRKAFGIPELLMDDFVALASDLLRSYAAINKTLVTPLPWPYFHLCKTLLFAYFLIFPFFVEYQLGWWANLVELTILSIALFGIDAIATELENPFGDDENDLDIYEKIGALEQEVMFFLRVAGDQHAKNCFLWQDMPTALTHGCASPVSHFLALRTQVETKGLSKEIIPGGKSPWVPEEHEECMPTDLQFLEDGEMHDDFYDDWDDDDDDDGDF